MAGDVGTEDGGENDRSSMPVDVCGSVGDIGGGEWGECDMVSYESTDSGLSDIVMTEEKGDGDMCT